MLLCDVCSIVLWTRGPYEFPAAIVTGNWKWKCFFFFSRVPAAVLSVCSQWRPLPLFLTYCLIIPAAVMLASGKVISPPPSLFCGLHNTTPLVYLFFFFIVKRRFSFLHTESILRGSGRNRSSFFFVCSSDPRRLVFFIAPLLHTKEKKEKIPFGSRIESYDLGIDYHLLSLGWRRRRRRSARWLAADEML